MDRIQIKHGKYTNLQSFINRTKYWFQKMYIYIIYRLYMYKKISIYPRKL